MEVTVVVATFGDAKWIDLAQERAVPSAESHGVPTIHTHADALHIARNGALQMVTTEWVCHLDADDELEPGYFEAMEKGTADLRAPAVRYVSEGGVCEDPAVPPRIPLESGNWLVIGTLVKTEMARAVGWRDWAFFEDWDFWMRCSLAGASMEAIPDAVYRAWIRSDSRNRFPSAAEQKQMWRAIRSANLGVRS